MRRGDLDHEHRRSRGSDRGGSCSSEALSSFYRDRFGSHSPEEYMNLRISHMDPRLGKDDVKDMLDKEFRSFAPFEVKIVRNPHDDQRLAYCNFERPEAARKIRATMMERLRKLLGKRVHVDPAGIIRDQDGKYIPDRYNRALQAERGGRRSPPRGASSRGRSPIRPAVASRRGHDDAQSRRPRELNHDEATRTLFVGNMPGDIRESEIRKVFEKYGPVEEVDIKNPPETHAAYAFVLFETVEQAMHAKAEEHDQAIRPGTTRCKIGFGKSQVSNRLWVGGLGDWTSEDLLVKEFDRYGCIDRIDYVPGQRHAYIRFADTSAASDACKGMRGFPLGGRDKCIMVDFARDERVTRNGREREDRGDRHGASRERKRDRSHSHASPASSGGDDSSKRMKRHRGPQTPPESPVRSPILSIETVGDLEASVESTWNGVLMLKKTEYAVRLHRVSGTDELTQKLLRDGEGEPLKLQITQRLPLASQEALEERLMSCSKKQLSLLIAVPSGARALTQLIHYLADKEAAGVVALPGGVLYVLGPCAMAEHLLAASAPGVELMRAESGADCILLVLALKQS